MQNGNMIQVLDGEATVWSEDMTVIASGLEFQNEGEKKSDGWYDINFNKIEDPMKGEQQAIEDLS